MGTLDRYIARQYLFNILALIVLLFSFVVMVDVALNVDQFLDKADKMASELAPADEGRTAGPIRRLAITALLVVDLWWPRLLQLYTYLVGLVLVAAMGFTLTQLVRHRELVAVLAGGISLHRVARPILIVASFMLAIKVINQEFVLSRPDIAPLLTRGNNQMGDRDWSEFPVELLRDADNRVWLARSFDPATGEMVKVTIWERETGGRVRRVISAESATWRAGGWDLEQPRVDPITLAGGQRPAGDAGPTAPTRLESDLDPAALKINRFKAYSDSLSWTQIAELLSSPGIDDKVREKLQRTRYARVSQVLSALLSLLVAMPFYLLREPRNMLTQTLKCAPIGITCLIGGVLLSLVEWPGLPPGFAVFIPVLVLIPIAVAMVSWVRT
jgi:lipopolysaccharide export system permease protein